MGSIRGRPDLEGPEDELLEEYHAKLDRALIERSDPAGVAEAIAKLEPSGEPLLVRTAARWLADQVMVGDGRYPVLRSRHTALSPDTQAHGTRARRGFPEAYSEACSDGRSRGMRPTLRWPAWLARRDERTATCLPRRRIEGGGAVRRQRAAVITRRARGLDNEAATIAHPHNRLGGVRLDHVRFFLGDPSCKQKGEPEPASPASRA